jgi:SAM-dependent methyltransferase
MTTIDADVTTQPRCPICDSQATRPLVERANVPVHQNLLFASATEARGMKCGTLALRECTSCGFVFNVAFDGTLLDYGQNYENTQTWSGVNNRYVDELVRRLVEVHGICDGQIVEVGCGKGGFLLKLLSHPGNHSQAVGFDPAYVGPETLLDGRLRFVRDFYGPSTATRADVVVCRHVIEHISRPLELLRSVRAALGSAVGSKIFFETPSVAWIIRHRVLWDLFYEHCSIFTPYSLGLALTQAGFRVTAIDAVMDGQYLWAEAEAGAGTWPEPGPSAEPVPWNESARVARWQHLLAERRARGAVAVWGAAAKGVTFCNLADPQGVLLAGVVDLNPVKQGKFLAGTGHRILAPAELADHAIRTCFVLNPAYVSEIEQTLADLGVSADVIDMMALEEPTAS